MDSTPPTLGMIVSRKCPTCGHHEIGYVDRNDTFHALKPGDMIQVMSDSGGFAAGAADIPAGPVSAPERDEILAELVPWVPKPLLADKKLRLKYGVLIGSDMRAADMSSGLYGIAFRQKLHHLIEEEKYTPLPLILDRYFGTPYLASGGPIQIIESLMNELDELKIPLERVQNWLDKKDDESLRALIHPKTIQDLEGNPVDEEQLKQELYTLTLEEFFEML